jgi:hypothetical protein
MVTLSFTVAGVTVTVFAKTIGAEIVGETGVPAVPPVTLIIGPTPELLF